MIPGHASRSELRTVLSIDGGGVRGIIPAMILAEVERRTEEPISRLFDLIAGTSTGGILALALTKPDAERCAQYSAEELVHLYDKRGPAIFPKSWRQYVPFRNIEDEKYSATGLETVLDEYLGKALMNEACTNLLLTSYDIELRRPHYFRRDDGFAMKDVARATSAAPTYFEPLKLPTGTALDYYALIDGGVFANNPAMCAFVEAQRLFSTADKFVILSLGTGQFTRRLPYEKVVDWGLRQWARPILDVVFDGVSDCVHDQLSDLYSVARHSASDTPLRGYLEFYHRFQVTLGDTEDSMDDASKDNLRDLKTLAADLINDERESLEIACAHLEERRHLTQKFPIGEACA